MAWLDWCKNELERAGLFNQDKGFYGGLAGKAVLELCELFEKQDHSGASAHYVLSIFKQLVECKPLTPLTGEPEEWIKVGSNLYQNKRCPFIFKKGVIAYNTEGRIFKDVSGAFYTDVYSRKKIDFPYIPKTEKINMPSKTWVFTHYKPYDRKHVEIVSFDSEKYLGVFELQEESGEYFAFIKGFYRHWKLHTADIAVIKKT